MAVLSVGELSVTLQRDGTREPFGFRLRGGSDIKEAFIIQRVKLNFVLTLVPFSASLLFFRNNNHHWLLLLMNRNRGEGPTYRALKHTCL